jgi:hypothetical protein
MQHDIPTYSEEQVEAAKAKYGAKCLKILEVYPDEDTEQPSLFLIKKPSPSLVYLLSSKEFDNNIEKSSNAMISNCVLAGDQELLNNDASVFTELVEKIGSLTKSARSSLKKV